MSTFDGRIPELPGIAIDSFDERIREGSQMFFLSHCHVDHMRGLTLERSLPGPLYLSPVSAVLIRHRYPQHAEVIRSLSAREQLALTVQPTSGEPSYELYVRTAPAEHCPGSVMFYFETKTVRILYTGDFRLTERTQQTLKESQIRPHIVYLDSTFLNSDYTYFPTRDESTQRIVSLCKEWLAADLRNVVSLWLPANYGSEDLFLQLFERLHERVHINERQRGPYMHFVSLADVLTDDCCARIHACTGTMQQRCGLACRTGYNASNEEELYIRTIRPSALRWRGLQHHEPFCKQSNNLFYVCYSAHASCEELAAFVRNLQPYARDIRFNVLADESDHDRKRQYVASILTEEDMTDSVASVSSERMQGDIEESKEWLNYDRIVYSSNVNVIHPIKDATDGSESEDIDDVPYSKLPKRARVD